MFVLVLYKKAGEVLMDIYFNRLTAIYTSKEYRHKIEGLLKPDQAQ